MTWMIRRFKTYTFPKDRWKYFEMSQCFQQDFEKFLKMDGSVDAALGHLWYENEPLMQRSEIECFMIYIFTIKLYVSQNIPCDDLRNEVKKMLSEDILEKYRPLLPTDEYELLASDIKELHLD